MLDNPNITLEKMIEVMAFGKDIIVILFVIVIAVLLYIYRYEISLFIKYGFSDSKDTGGITGLIQFMRGGASRRVSELEGRDISDKVDNLLNNFKNPVVDDEESNLLKSVDNLILSKSSKHIPPIFRSLKTIKTSNEIIYHFQNDGGRMHSFKINSIDEINISSEPKNNLELNESGYFKFEFENINVGNEVNFNLLYYDEANKFHEEKYKYSLLKNKLSIVEME
ncbi:MAG: hypothetical protein L3J41_11700 [Melioribacteraceae bacterium]|nr:hypothetical protein [Melioribacteraceae bacterium]